MGTCQSRAQEDGISGDALKAFVNHDEIKRPDGKKAPGLRHPFDSTDEIHTLGHLCETMLKEMRDATGDSGEYITNCRRSKASRSGTSSGCSLLGYAVALLTYNVLSVVKAALRVAHGPKLIDNPISTYYLADEVAGMWRGMEVAIPDERWK